MEFITAEQFLKEDKEVQEVFVDWWKPSLYDLVSYEHIVIQSGPITYRKDTKCLDGSSGVKIANINKKDYIPLLTEGQLRKFIEDKSSDFDLESEAVIEIEFYAKKDLEDKVTQKEIGYLIKILDKSDGLLIDCCCDLGTDLLQAYWKVAVKIAKESIKH